MTRFGGRRFLLVLVAVMAAAPVVYSAWRRARDGDRNMALVRQAATAHRRVSYRGEIAWRKTRWSWSVEVQHDATSGRTRYEWRPGLSYVTTRPSRVAPDPAAWCLDVDALQKNYRAERMPDGSYLGRPVRKFRLSARHAGRPTVLLTVDRETSLPLKLATLGPDGQLGKVIAYRKLTLQDQAVEPPQPRLGARHSIPRDAVDEAVAFRPLEPAYLPAGFVLSDCSVSGVTIKKLRYTYTDGISRIQLTQQRIPTPAQMETEYTLKYGARRTAWHMRRYRARCLRALTRGAPKAPDGSVVARRRHSGRQRLVELTVGDLRITLQAPRDLADEESARVLRSLRTP